MLGILSVYYNKKSELTLMRRATAYQFNFTCVGLSYRGFFFCVLQQEIRAKAHETRDS